MEKGKIAEGRLLSQGDNGLTKRYRTLIFEKLSISNMVKNHNLAISILDATWYKIKQLAAYKAEIYQEVPAKDTNQICSSCGYLPDIKKKLDDRIHECLSCGLKLDRDHNCSNQCIKIGSGIDLCREKTSACFY